MRFYRTEGGTWLATQEEAVKLAGRGRFKPIDVPTDKPGLLAWLNENVVELETEPQIYSPAPTAPNPAPAKPSYFEISFATDEAFEALPLARQLYLAEMALERAIDKLKEG